MKIKETTVPVERTFVLEINEDELVALRSYITAAVIAINRTTATRSTVGAAAFITKTNDLTNKKNWDYDVNKVFK